MDTLRGQFGSFDDDTRDEDYYADIDNDDIGREAPPSPVGQDERRMQVRAYNHWASLLRERNFPSIEDLDPESLPDFGPYSVLLDFTSGIENPAVQYLGEELGHECGTDGTIRTLEDVPGRSLLSRITDHYMQILANQAPIGFEAEFVNQRGSTLLYRGILLPFSSDDSTIDFIYGVINWKEVADQLTTDELLLEIDQVLDNTDGDETGPFSASEDSHEPHRSTAIAEWNDGPAPEDYATQAEEDQPDDRFAGGLSDAFAVGSEGPADASGHISHERYGSLLGNGASFDDDGHDQEDDEESLSEFALPDIGDADEEDTINHAAYASLAPASEDDGDGPSLAGLRNRKAKKPLDLSLASAIEPVFDNDAPDGSDAGEEPPASAFGQENSPFADFLGSDFAEETADDDVDDWSTPFEYDDERQLPASDKAAEEPEPVAEATLPQTDTASGIETAHTEIILPSLGQDDSEMGLYDTLADARELAQVAHSSEDRSRAALYAAVGRAYDVSLAAQDEPEDFAELIEENGLTVQDRAPMTPVVKLVFGADYDKTRLTEYAAVLTHAHRVGIERGALSDFLAKAEGGLKGVVQAERRLRKEEEGKAVEPLDAVRASLAKKLRKLEPIGFKDIEADGAEFGVVMIRRLENGDIVILGEISDDIPLVEKVARKLVG